MKLTVQNKLVMFLLILLAGFSIQSCKEKIPQELPNILWITSEDNSPFLGCYGDEFATTPNLDKLASEGFLYTHAYANAPVCAPTRNTIITGVYANSGGHEPMRSYYNKSEKIIPYPSLLKGLGYYCTNNSKTDYNTNSIDPKQIWDESSPKAHYKNRKEGQPFFAVFNSAISHESSIHKSIPSGELRHDPARVPLPPYHPAVPEMKHDWAQYYDKVEDMDSWVGKMLNELEEEGLAENTIVFYYGDHGGVVARSKRYVYETGTRVPFIIRIPEKFKYLFPAKKKGSQIDRLISFVDLAPTLMSIAGKPVPEFMQGNAFLGKQKTKDPEYAFMFRGRMDERYDMSRAVRDKKFRYIKNYMPHRIYGQHLNYLWLAPSVRSWEQAYLNGECNEIQSVFWNPKPSEELYDTENDPWEIKNLANDPQYKDILDRMRKANKEWISGIFDTGFIPEADMIERAGNESFYDFVRSGKVNLQAIMDAAELATQGDPENIDTLKSYLTNYESAIRYWGATGLLILGEKGRPGLEELKKAANDPSGNVAVVAAEAIYTLGEKEEGISALLKVIETGNEFSRCHALNAIDCIGENSPDIIKCVVNLINSADTRSRNAYDLRASKWLIEKWGLNPEDYNITFEW